MRLKFVSDVHGNVAGLREVARQPGQLVVLGDLIDYVDYRHASGGILGRIFGAQRVQPFIDLRLAGDFERLRHLNRDLWDSIPDPVGTLTEVVAGLYRDVLDAVGPDALLTLGNVDVADLWNEVAGGELPYRDGEVVELAGRRLGFVAGGASRRPGTAFGGPSQVWRPFIRGHDDYRAAVRALGPVDILCAHVPPAIPLLRYDVAPGRLEMCGPGLMEAIDEHRPALSVHGHVHQPIARRLRRGRTECVNVGHFQRFPTPFEIELR
ncbi:MAG TPA: metallophosphoesterase family protein [Nakamurella sp.]